MLSVTGMCRTMSKWDFESMQSTIGQNSLFFLLCIFLKLPGTRGTWRRMRYMYIRLYNIAFISHPCSFGAAVCHQASPCPLYTHQRHTEYELGVLMVKRCSRPEKGSNPRSSVRISRALSTRPPDHSYQLAYTTSLIKVFLVQS